MKLAREAGVAEKMSAETRSAATMLAHFAYGGATGAIYGAVSDDIPASTLTKGIGFGLLVWTASYLGFLPGTGILKMATKHPARRNLLMIGAHVVFGVTTGALAALLNEEAHGRGAQPFSTTWTPHRDV
ncbi:MAG TPA: DUF6789 family protein [Chthoniobacterales bacterium]|jgi:putative membrane protein